MAPVPFAESPLAIALWGMKFEPNAAINADRITAELARLGYQITPIER